MTKTSVEDCLDRMPRDDFVRSSGSRIAIEALEEESCIGEVQTMDICTPRPFSERMKLVGTIKWSKGTLLIV